ncbi:hypothetical protein FB470_004715 [Amycolatopsis thermophila]|uniref:Uncharacterized protein n=1 Tax=Amycolatopsis thermophila TaxID=206084 RepID=A0ABU0F0J3_9PSEU|nr:hypothetical protein [Amycolatopsis thermophila]
MLEAIHAFRARVVAEVTAGWEAADRAAPASLLVRFAEDFGEFAR